MNALLGRMAINMVIAIIVSMMTFCFSLSNFKTAKVLGKADDGKAEVSTVTGISSSAFSSFFLLPEFNLRYPLKPGEFEMGNKIWLMAGPGFEGFGLITAGAGFSVDGKLKILSINRFSMSADFESEFLIVTTGVWDISISPTLLMTYEFMDWLSITIAPKVKYDINFRYLFYGGILTLDLGKKISVMPEFGYFDNYDINNNSHSPFFYFGVGHAIQQRAGEKETMINGN